MLIYFVQHSAVNNIFGKLEKTEIMLPIALSNKETHKSSLVLVCRLNFTIQIL